MKGWQLLSFKKILKQTVMQFKLHGLVSPGFKSFLLIQPLAPWTVPLLPSDCLWHAVCLVWLQVLLQTKTHGAAPTWWGSEPSAPQRTVISASYSALDKKENAMLTVGHSGQGPNLRAFRKPVLILTHNWSIFCSCLKSLPILKLVS